MTVIKGIAWDCDGTLADSEVLAMPAAVAAAIRHVKKRKTDLVISAEQPRIFVQQLMGKTIPEIGEAIGAHYGVFDMPKDFKDHVTSYTIELLSTHCLPIEGAIEAIQACAQQGFKQWIVTSSASDRVSVTLKATGLSEHFPEEEQDWFSAIKTKPSPEVYLRSLEKREFKAENVGAVEDSPTGVAAASRAGIGLIIGFTGGSHIPEEGKDAHAQLLLAQGAHHVVRDLREIPLLITAHNIKVKATCSQRPKGQGAPLIRNER